MTLKVHCDPPGERTAPKTSKFLQRFAQLISSYHAKGITAQPEYQDLHSFHKSSPALPTQHQQARTEFSQPCAFSFGL